MLSGQVHALLFIEVITMLTPAVRSTCRESYRVIDLFHIITVLELHGGRVLTARCRSALQHLVWVCPYVKPPTLDIFN